MPPLQLKVYGAVPPAGVRFIAPLEPPKQEMFVTTVVPETAVAGWPTVAFTVAAHPLASVMMTVYVPAVSPVRSSFVMPPPKLKVYGAVPPEPNTAVSCPQYLHVP